MASIHETHSGEARLTLRLRLLHQGQLRILHCTTDAERVEASDIIRTVDRLYGCEGESSPYT